MRSTTTWAAGCLGLFSLLLVAGCEGKGPVPKDDVERVVRKLEGSTSARKRAEERLYETEPDLHWKYVLPLIARKSASVDARAAAIRVIGHTCGRNGIPGAVLDAAADAEPALRFEASRAMIAWGDPEMAIRLKSLRKVATDAAIQKDLDALLADLEAGRAAWYQKRLVSASDPMERAMSARWLSEIGTEKDVPGLIRAFETTEDGLIRQECVLALARIGGEEAKTFTRGLLTHQNPYTRGAAAIAEITLRDPAAIPELKLLVATDTVGDVRISAATALGNIGGEVAKAALAESCKLGESDKRLDAACSAAQKRLAGAP